MRRLVHANHLQCWEYNASSACDWYPA
jgi:hypothetical protein